MERVREAWNVFFFRRTSQEGCQVGGAIRIAVGVLFVADRLLLGRDLDTLLSPSHGVVPREPGSFAAWSLLQMDPQNDKLLWGLYWVGLVQGILLVLGILPRLQVLGIFLNLVSFHRHNNLMWDEADVMLRLWSFFLLFLPLHHWTVYDFLRKVKRKDESWPMWPFRLWQIQICVMYASSAATKLLGPYRAVWQEGTAFYWIIHSNDYSPGLFHPELVLNRLRPLQWLTWATCFVESLGWTGVWMADIRADWIAVMILLHMSLAVLTHRLVWNGLAIVGWLLFLVQADYLPPLQRRRFLRHAWSFQPHPPRIPVGVGGWLLQLGIMVLVTSLAVDTWPVDVWKRSAGWIEPSRRFIRPLVRSIGVWQAPWNMYRIDAYAENSYYQIFLQLENGTVVDKRSPTWRGMSWWELQRSAPLRKYFSNFRYSRQAWLAYVERMVRDHPTTVAVELVRLWERPQAPPESGWAPARRSLRTGWENLLVVRYCRDEHEDCRALASRGMCTTNADLMARVCSRTCQTCGPPEIVWGDDEAETETLSEAMPKENHALGEGIASDKVGDEEQREILSAAQEAESESAAAAESGSPGQCESFSATNDSDCVASDIGDDHPSKVSSAEAQIENVASTAGEKDCSGEGESGSSANTEETLACDEATRQEGE